MVSSKRGRKILPTTRFSPEQIGTLTELYRASLRIDGPKEMQASQNRYVSYFGNYAHAASSPEAVQQLLALPVPTTRLERQLHNKMRQLAARQKNVLDRECGPPEFQAAPQTA
jgi:hypothetical protein